MTRSSRLTPQRSRRWPKMANSYSLELSDLTVHGVYFEPTVEILPNRIKVRKFSPVKTRLPFSNPYKYGWIPWPKHEENWIKKS
jgi:hypothetical protein